MNSPFERIPEDFSGIQFIPPSLRLDFEVIPNTPEGQAVSTMPYVVGLEGEKHLCGAVDRIVKAGTVCYQSSPKRDAGKFIKTLISKGHESVLEHEKVTFYAVTDRGVTHELVRHRIASYSQESTRYCNYANAPLTFIHPPWASLNLLPDYATGQGNELTDVLKTQEALNILGGKLKEDGDQIFLKSCLLSTLAYTTLNRTSTWGRPQKARAVLPNALKAEIVSTMNFRELRHFFELRGSLAAHPQIKQLAVALLLKLQHYVPFVFDDFQTFDKEGPFRPSGFQFIKGTHWVDLDRLHIKKVGFQDVD